MAGTREGAAKRDRCSCGAFLHPGKPCGRPGPKPTKTDAEKREVSRAYTNQWRKDHPERWREIVNNSNAKVKVRVLSHYSDGVPACACYKKTSLVFLTLDHIDGDGAAKRRTAGSRGGVSYYRHLIRQGFPDGYRVLCWNCNAAYAMTGTCPHLTRRKP